MKFKNLIKAVAFMLIFFLLFGEVTKISTVSVSDPEYQRMASFFKEKKNTADAVYIGSSNCYAFWNPNVAWDEYGITVLPYTCSSLPLIAAEYLIKEARKRQPDAVFLVNINTLGEDGVADVVKHRLLDYMPLSKNKLEFLNYLCDLKDLEFNDRLEYYLPIIKFHSKWQDLSSDNFSDELNGMKNADVNKWFFTNVYDVSKKFTVQKEESEITKELEESINKLLDYCESEDVKVVFVTSPRAEKAANGKKLNTVNKIIAERGFDVLDLRSKTDEIKFDLKNDYYNITHTNIHGSIKFTRYMSEYLIEKYGFSDKHGKSGYESWDTARDKYYEMMAPYILPFEMDGKRDFSIDAADGIKAVKDGDSVRITWNASKNADGYTVFSKTGRNGSWKELSSTEECYLLADVKPGKAAVFYTVAPYSLKGEGRSYGNCRYNGISAAQ